MMGLLAKPFLCLSLLLAQAGQTVVPVSEESHHRVLFQNKYARVIDAVVPPGDTTLFHTHALDNVPVAISGGKMRTEVMGGQVTESTVETGGVWFARGSYTHRISNTGATALRFIDAEILASPGTKRSASPLDRTPGHKLEVENEQVRIYRVKLGPGETTGLHTHARPMLRVEITGGRVGINSRGRSRKVVEVKAGEFEWRGESETLALANVGEPGYEAVEIEWK